ncbi:MAG: DmsC/YnfH family molybdoenzyme membrane anchor subunit [Bacteroidales bacterium]|nr:DmsC/YnfH family molybdoenzyme membrane anchor subunit [Bacteroidales bacterium]
MLWRKSTCCLTIPVWNSTFTLVQFFLTTIILGGALTAIFIPEVNTKGKAIFVNLLLVLVLASIMVWVGNTLLLAEGGLSATKSLQVLVAENSVLFYGRIVLLALVVMVILLPWFRRKMPETISFFTMLFVMLLIAEVAGRYLFYAS